MELGEYLPMFLAEAREHLEHLNLAVVRIEEEPSDRETVDEVFRIAHSIKGMSATMGFRAMAALTHEMEDVFELLRQRSGGLDREAIDVLLACLDALEAAVEAIERTGAETLEADPLVARLRGLARERTRGQHADRTGEADEPADLHDRAAGRRMVRIRAELAADVLMPSVRAFMVLAAAGEFGDVLHSAPAEDAVDAFAGRAVAAWVATEAPEEAIAAAVAEVPELAGAPVVEEVPAGGEVVALAPVLSLAADADAAPPAAPARRGARTVRVDAERLDALMHAMGELVVERTRVEALATQAAVPGLTEAIGDLTRTSQALQAMVMQVRMIPVEAVFVRFPRLVRDLSATLGKDVELVLAGQDTELDRTVVDALGDPLVHLVRNALDHGLEGAGERAAAGKPPTATLEIGARHAGGSVIITVRDDGRGIDPERVARKAVQRGLIDAPAAAAVDGARAAELLFTPGFSTAETTSDISGRGVGMDAVRTAIRAVGGEVTLCSAPGAGTTAEIRLPLTLAIMSALLVRSGGEPFAIPLDRVQRTLRLDGAAVRSAAGQRLLVVDEGVLPLCDLAATVARSGAGVGAPITSEYAVVARAGERDVALAVDVLVGQRELVARPLPGAVGQGVALSGGAVLADGEIALIVDCDALTTTTAAAAA
jgi:two-component system chemotaxis sensor kinase CheA